MDMNTLGLGLVGASGALSFCVKRSLAETKHFRNRYAEYLKEISESEFYWQKSAIGEKYEERLKTEEPPFRIFGRTARNRILAQIQHEKTHYANTQAQIDARLNILAACISRPHLTYLSY